MQQHDSMESSRKVTNQNMTNESSVTVAQIHVLLCDALLPCAGGVCVLVCTVWHSQMSCLIRALGMYSAFTVRGVMACALKWRDGQESGGGVSGRERERDCWCAHSQREISTICLIKLGTVELHKASRWLRECSIQHRTAARQHARTWPECVPRPLACCNSGFKF